MIDYCDLVFLIIVDVVWYFQGHQDLFCQLMVSLGFLLYLVFLWKDLLVFSIWHSIHVYTSMVLSIKEGVSGLEGSVVFLAGVKVDWEGVDVKVLLKRDIKSGLLMGGREVILITITITIIRFKRSCCFESLDFCF